MLKTCSGVLQTFFQLKICLFLPAIQHAGQRSRNCLKGLKSCKNSMSFSSRQPDPPARKAPKRSPRKPWSYFFWWL